jgi:hypothetical protein
MPYQERLAARALLIFQDILKSITHPTMLARYNLRGQEASDDSDAFFFEDIKGRW